MSRQRCTKLIKQLSVVSCQLSVINSTHSLTTGYWQLPFRSLASTCMAERPLTRIILFRLLSPAAIVTDDRGTFKTSARNAIQASLARPSIGGAVSATFSASPTSPVMAFFFARGCALTWKVAPDGVLRMGIIVLRASQKWLYLSARRSSLLRWQLRSRVTYP